MFRFLIALTMLASAHASAKSFSQYCVGPDNDAQINTINRMLRAVGLPTDRTPTICAAGQSRLQVVESLSFLYVTVHKGFETIVIEPITDLKPLESVPWLKSLELRGPTIAEAFVDGNPLAALPYLEKLTLSGAPLREISMLSPLARLESLTLNDSEVTDISPLAQLTALRVLDLSANAISDLSILSRVPRLTELTIHASRTTEQLSNLDFVKPLVNLRVLRLTSHQIKYLFALQDLRELRVLDLYSNRIMDVEPIVGLPLVELNLSSNNIHDASLLARIKTLEKLSMASNKLDSTEAFSKLTNLRFLNLAGNALTYAVFHDLDKLEDLNLNANKLTYLWGVPEKPALKKLNVDHNKLTSLDRLEFMPGLEDASFYENEISEISQLAYHKGKKLKFLSLTRNPVKSVEALKDYRDLSQLDIQDTLVQDFSILAPLQKPHENSQGKVIQLWLHN